MRPMQRGQEVMGISLGPCPVQISAHCESGGFDKTMEGDPPQAQDALTNRLKSRWGHQTF